MGFSFSKLFSQLHAEGEVRILMVGLDDAGKTTILCYLDLGEIVTATPVIDMIIRLFVLARFNVESLEYKNITLQVWDAGDHERTRPLWGQYLQNTQGLVFVVDSNDLNRIAEARNELHQMLHEDELRDTALLIFANKADLPSAMTSAEISDKLGLFSLAQHQWYITDRCAKSGEGLYEGFQWLYKNIAQRIFFIRTACFKQLIQK